MSDSAIASAVEFGKKACDVPGYTDCWVTWKTAGYPRKLRREWDEARGDAEKLWGILMRYAVAWNLRDLAGEAVALPEGARPIELMDNTEDALTAWLIRAFLAFWLNELTAPRPNS